MAFARTSLVERFDPAFYLAEAMRTLDALHEAPSILNWTPAQQSVLNDAANPACRVIVVVGGERAGKSIVGAEAFLRWLAKYPTDDFMIAAPTYKVLARGTLPALWERWGRGWEREARYDKADHSLVFRNGRQVFLFSAEHSNPAIAMNLRGIWADEAGLMNEGQYNDYRSRLRTLGGQLIITTTPYYVGDWLNDTYDIGVSGKTERIRSHCLLYKDNPTADLDEIAWEYNYYKQLGQLNEFFRRFEGRFVAAQGMVYPFDYARDVIPHPDEMEGRAAEIAPDSKRRWSVHDELLAEGWFYYRTCEGNFILPPKHWPVYGGVDWGDDDPCSVCLCAIAPDETLIWFREVYTSQTTIGEIFAPLQEEPYWKQVQMLYCDSYGSATQMTNSLSDYGIHMAAPHKAEKIYGEQRMRELLAAGQMRYIQRQVDNNIRSVANLRYEPRRAGMEVHGKIVHKDSHGADSQRYCVAEIPLVHWDSRDKNRFPIWDAYQRGRHPAIWTAGIDEDDEETPPVRIRI